MSPNAYGTAQQCALSMIYIKLVDHSLAVCLVAPSFGSVFTPPQEVAYAAHQAELDYSLDVTAVCLCAPPAAHAHSADGRDDQDHWLQPQADQAAHDGDGRAAALQGGRGHLQRHQGGTQCCLSMWLIVLFQRDIIRDVENKLLRPAEYAEYVIPLV